MPPTDDGDAWGNPERHVMFRRLIFAEEHDQKFGPLWCLVETWESGHTNMIVLNDREARLIRDDFRRLMGPEREVENVTTLADDLVGTEHEEPGGSSVPD